MELLTVPLYRLIEEGKINRKQFEDRVDRWSSKVDKLEDQAALEVKRLLDDLDKEIRSEITNFADNDALDRSDINKAIDNAVDKFEAERSTVMRKTRQKAVDVAHEFRQDVTGMTKDHATSTPMGGKGSKKMVRDLSKMQDEANKGFGKFLRKKVKAEIADGVLKGKTPNQIAKDMVAKRIVTPTRKRGDASARNALAKAEKLARADVRQTFNAANQVSSAGQKVKGKKKVWVSKMDGIERVEHHIAHIHYGIGGRPGPIPINKNFMVGGERLMFPLDPKGSDWNTANCRCISVEITPEADEMISKRGGKRKVRKIPTKRQIDAEMNRRKKELKKLKKQNDEKARKLEEKQKRIERLKKEIADKREKGMKKAVDRARKKALEDERAALAKKEVKRLKRKLYVADRKIKALQFEKSVSPEKRGIQNADQERRRQKAIKIEIDFYEKSKEVIEKHIAKYYE